MVTWGKRPRGFSLPELILAAALLTLCIYAMMSLLPTSGAALQEARDIESMRGYVQAEIERVRQAGSNYTWPASGVVTAAPVKVTLNGTAFNEWLTTGTLDVHGPYALHFIAVRMQREDGKGMPIELSTRVVVTP